MAEAAHRRLAKIAVYLGPDPQSQNIDWWRLPDQAPRFFIGGLTGPLVGCVIGRAVGLVVATKFGVYLGVPLGIVASIAGCLLAGVASIQHREFPRAVDLHFQWDYWRFTACLAASVVAGVAFGYADARHGGPVAGLAAAAVIGPVCAVTATRIYGRTLGVVAGITNAVALGLPSGLAVGNGQPVLSGFLSGLAWAVSGWVLVMLVQPAQDKFVVTPRSLLARDRIGTLTVSVVGGMTSGIIYGIALGPLVEATAFAALAVSQAFGKRLGTVHRLPGMAGADRHGAVGGHGLSRRGPCTWRTAPGRRLLPVPAQ